MYTRGISEAVLQALKAAGKRQLDLAEILKVSSPQAASKKVREGRWTAEELIAVAAFTGGKLIFEMPNGEQYELK